MIAKSTSWLKKKLLLLLKNRNSIRDVKKRIVEKYPGHLPKKCKFNRESFFKLCR